MIRYTCGNPSCLVVLETVDTQGGQTEPCPACGTVNRVPWPEQGLQDVTIRPDQQVPVGVPGIDPPAGPAGQTYRRWRVPSIVSLPTGALLVLLFFLPWVNVTCNGMVVARASGLQLATGEISIDSSPLPFGPPVPSPSQPKFSPDKIRARPWFWAGLVIPVLIAATALAGVLGVGRSLPLGALWLALGVVGLTVMVLAATTEYAEAEMPPPEQRGSAYPLGPSPTSRPGPWGPAPPVGPGGSTTPTGPTAPPGSGSAPPSPQSLFGAGTSNQLATEVGPAVILGFPLYLTIFLGGIGQIVRDRARLRPRSGSDPAAADR